VSPYLGVYSVAIANISQNSISVPINIGLSKQTVKTLIDSGTGGLFIDQNFAKNFDINYLDKPVKAYNVDGTENKWGTINAYINLEFFLDKQKFKERFYVTGFGKQKIILGFPWLHKYNPIIDWKKEEITFKPFRINWRHLMEKGKQIRQEQQPKIEEVVDREEPRNQTTLPLKENKMGVYIELLETDVWIHKTNIATELAIEENGKKTDRTDEQLVPAEYHEYLDIFSEEKAHRFPKSRLWDHKIEMKEGFEPKSFKNYNLTLAEQLELDKFLKENLEKGYIQPSQSPMASLFFFVSKKDGKLQPCQDYRYLNDWTVKNSYPLPLISEIMDKLKGAKYFTKLDMRWGYNNVRIRKGDEWKVAFKMNKGLFEPTVMFFGMCNSPATFQAMMDDIFMTMIDNQLVIVYMDDILIFADTKEELERITKLVLEKLREHDLFLKAKKCEFCQNENWISRHDHWRRENLYGRCQTWRN
jgi:Reverse transcriptase (RNA-dependent DNA polymerase)